MGYMYILYTPKIGNIVITEASISIYLSTYLSITDIILDVFENGVYDYSIYPQTLVTLWLLRRQILAYAIFSYIHLKTETRNHDSTGFWFQK